MSSWSARSDQLRQSRTFVVFIVYFSLLLDNVLLTVIVPILPDYLSSKSINTTKLQNVNSGRNVTEYTLRYETLELENGSVGLLLSAKAFVQLFCNPLVGTITRRIGYRIPVLAGTIQLLLASLLFGFGDSYGILLLARSIQGVASACVGVSGMCLVADLYPEKDRRSRVMGIVLGSIALGVLIGYPFGGFFYDFFDKGVPFFIIAVFVAVNIFLQLCFMDFNNCPQVPTETNTGWKSLLMDKYVLLIAGAICTSTSAMAILEPCLPIWLMRHLKPKKWQLGTVFIPDSLGYLIGTNFLGSFAYMVGQWKVSVAALLLVGVSSFLVPSVQTVSQLIWPHFGLGLGIGALDAALVPLLANLVDVRQTQGHGTHYGSVYALQQMAVSLAYSVSPVLGGELAQSIGFSRLMRTVGLVNILYSPLLILLANKNVKPVAEDQTGLVQNDHTKYNSTTDGGKYTRFQDSLE